MTEFRLTYFDFNGGRGEPVRIALHAAGIQFDDVRWSFSDFTEKRQSLRFSAVPAMEIDGELITQSNAMSRYIGKLTGLYPDDALQALYCDEVLEAMEDLNHYVVQTFGLEGEELKEARQRLMDGRMSVFIQGLAECLKRGGGQYFSNSALTIADLKMYVQLKQLLSGNLDHIPADFVTKLAPEFKAYMEGIDQEPVVLAYYASIES